MACRMFNLHCNMWDAGPMFLVVACGIWFLDQALNPGPLHWECKFLVPGPSGKSLCFFSMSVSLSLL